MTAERQDFEMMSGDDHTLNATIRDALEAENGVVIDLSGLSAAEWVLSKRKNTAELINKTLGSGITVVDAANGRLDVTMVPADTAALKGKYYHECEIVDVSGKTKTVFWGTGRINQDKVNA